MTPAERIMRRRIAEMYKPQGNTPQQVAIQTNRAHRPRVQVGRPDDVALTSDGRIIRRTRGASNMDSLNVDLDIDAPIRNS